MEMTLEQQFAEFLRVHHPELVESAQRGIKEPENFHARRIIPTPYQEFPKMMYSPVGERPVVVMKKKEQENLEADGWKPKPFQGHIINADGSITVPLNLKETDSKKAN